MTNRFIRSITVGMMIGLGIGISVAAKAEDVSGTWIRDTGASKVRFAKCGNSLCGTIIWLKDQNGPARIGQKVFYDMKPLGENIWEGSAFNPEDGKTYTGKMTLSGLNLTTSGCGLGGLICKSATWTRTN